MWEVGDGALLSFSIHLSLVGTRSGGCGKMGDGCWEVGDGALLRFLDIPSFGWQSKWWETDAGRWEMEDGGW